MAIANGGNVKAPEPPGPPGPLGPIITLSVSGDFTYPQVKGQYVNCTGLTLTCTVRFEGNTWVDNIDCSGLCDGTDFIESGSWNIFVSTNSAEGERYALWDNSGEQYIILTAYSTTIGGSDSVTKTVTVVEPEPTEKLIINAELYEAVEELDGYSVTFPSGSNMSITCYVSINDEAVIEGSTWASSVAGQTITGIQTIKMIDCAGAKTVSNKNVTYNNLDSPSDVDTNGTYSGISSPGPRLGSWTINLTFLEDTTFTTFRFAAGQPL